MAKKGKVWYVILGVFYLGLGVLTYVFHQRLAHIASLHTGEEIKSDFEGNDWVSWEDTPEGVKAVRVHPLPSYKRKEYTDLPQVGDRLLEIRRESPPIGSAETVDKISKAAPPGRAFTYIVDRPSPVSNTSSQEELSFSNGFRLGFSFNEYGGWWRVSIWLVAIGAFISFVMLAILFPLIRGNWRDYLPLLCVVASALLFLSLQAFHSLYLIVDNSLLDEADVQFEKGYIWAYMLLLFTYTISYFYYKSGISNFLSVLPSVGVSIFWLYLSADIIFVKHQLKFFHDLLENFSYLFFFYHLAGALLLYVAGSYKGKSARQLLGILSIGVLSLVTAAYYVFQEQIDWIEPERVLLLFTFLQFFPLFNSTFLQLQFGKVSVVVTRTFQYLVFFVVAIFLYLLINQLFTVYLSPNAYSRLLEIVVFLITITLMRVVYLANENKFSRYFVSSQQEKRNHFNSFIAQIPQYTSSRILRKDLVDQLVEYFGADTVHLWWKGDVPDSMAEKRYHENHERIYQQLKAHQAVWSKNKEIAPFRLDDELEELVLKSGYSLVYPITVNEDSYALLMLGKKKRGVYNLSDLELISRLVQQTQLTLNVLQLINREKELIQQTYEANLTALRSQINPHFLFNTLNSLTELVHESADLAEEAIEKLAFIFRYTLKKSSENFVSLSEEIKLISTYLDLEKIRFGDRLEIQIDVNPEVKDVDIPAFVIQTFVENCIKHGIAKILDKGLVAIQAYKEDNFLVCEVYDNGPGIDLGRVHQSTGLNNVIARLENIYDLKDLVKFENTGSGTLVTMRVPIMQVPNMS
ncbi:MAG: hypothetical protein D6730_07450 [Bacteroidetes bacterium]|nr:MAG: hypothetical protein D6730_07450 [Bacteroidota bacterium]